MHPLDNDGLVWRRLEEVRCLGNGQGQTTAHRALQAETPESVSHSQFQCEVVVNETTMTDFLDEKTFTKHLHWLGSKHACGILTGLAFCMFLCAARLTGPGSIMEPGNKWASSALKAADTASLGGVRGGVMKRGVVLGVGGITSDGWMKKPGAEEELEGTELWMGPTPEAAADVVWCSLASSLAFCQ